MIPYKLPLNDARRQRLRDDRLWVREIQRLTFLNLRYMRCPCSECRGSRRLQLRTIRKYLIRNGRDPTFRQGCHADDNGRTDGQTVRRWPQGRP
jgi:hypothetical protein